MIRGIDIDRLAASAPVSAESCPKAVCDTSSPERASDPEALLEEALKYWLALDNMRSERDRNIRYRSGDQWSDYVEDPEKPGSFVKEERIISRGGKIPLKHNFIQQYVRNIGGQMLSERHQPVVVARTGEGNALGEMLTGALQSCHRANRIDTLNMAMDDEMLLSGMACLKIRYSYSDNRGISDGRVESVNPERLFFNTDIEDPRLDEIRFIGQIHDYTPDQLVASFADTPEEEDRIRSYYSAGTTAPLDTAATHEEMTSFFCPSDTGKCRLFEIWHREGGWTDYLHDYADGSEETGRSLSHEADAENEHRRKIAAEAGIDPEKVPLVACHKRYEHKWIVSFVTPDGHLVAERVTPYVHGEHPYVIATMPMTDGRFRGMVSDIIDMQRYINRLIVMLDFIIGSSAKGVLMVPETAIPDGYSVADFAAEYVKANGVIVYRPNANKEVPYQVHKNSTAIGAWEMLSTQMQLIEQVSGISGAIQGRTAAAGTPSSLYMQQAGNSQLNLTTLFETLSDLFRRRDEKLLRVIVQYYREPRYLITSGEQSGQASIYDPALASRMLDFNLVLANSTNTPVYRQIFDDILMRMLDGGHITFEQYLESCSLPFAQRLLARIRQNDENHQEA
ncbi:MAG: hypothetical protein OSJ22_01230 [Rikenellaceae bacterium]|nr:hypothetical protein [Rikenellaceae bacterium]